MLFHSKLAKLVALAAVLTPISATAGELMPYEPPVPQAAQPTSPPAPSSPKTIVVVHEDVYRQFEIRVKNNLNEEERSQLVLLLEQGTVDARRSGDTSRESHYRRLLDILRRAE